MINFNPEVPVEYQKKGFYYSPENGIDHYLIEIVDIELKDRCKVIIYEIEIPDKLIDNGAEICTFESDYLLEILLCTKYYFPKFKNEYQWYYKDDNSDTVQSMADAMKFAIDIGLKIAEIKTY